jgi:hypothetical protein
MYHSALQKQNSIFHRRWAEVQQEQLLELRTGVFQATEVMASIQESITSSPPPTSRISSTDGEDDKFNRSSTGVSLYPNQHSAQGRRKFRQAAKPREHFVFCLRAPLWFKITNRAMEVNAQRAPFGWDFSFKMYNIVPFDAPIMEYASMGNIAAMQALLTKREASPNDRT